MELVIQAESMEDVVSLLARALRAREQNPEKEIVLNHNNREVVLPVGVSRNCSWWHPGIFLEILARTPEEGRRSYAEAEAFLKAVDGLHDLVAKLFDSSSIDKDEASEALELLQIANDSAYENWRGKYFAASILSRTDWETLGETASKLLTG
ncbi:hypothetical protein BVY02_01950 [bacterium J17]|nr:hypothetical protein BVY02_01950 [bacterium J17]